MTSGFTGTPVNEMVMAEPLVHPWDPRGLPSAYRRGGQTYCQISRGLQAIWATAFWALTLGLLLAAALPNWAAAASPTDAKVAIPGPLNFESCARLAIKQSPYFTKSKIEMDIRRMDESDSRYSMVPPLTFYSYYYVDQPKQSGFTPNPFSLTFSTTPYNPIGTYFTLQAQKIVTKMAVMSHLQMISKGLERLGGMFFNLATTKRLSVLQDDLINLCRENLTYAQNDLKIGTGTSLEVRLATQDLELAKVEKDSLESSQRRTLASLKNFLGLKPEQAVELDLRDASRQVIGNFDPAAATLEQTKARSFDLKSLEIQKEMQRYNIALAKASAFPNIILNVQNPSPLNARRSAISPCTAGCCFRSMHSD